ncbi:MAG: hypothetical protein ACK5HT_12995 [Draconibacterium sp.]
MSFCSASFKLELFPERQIDIEVNEKDPKKLIEVVKAIAPTFGGINLEDIKAPECFDSLGSEEVHHRAQNCPALLLQLWRLQRRR